jgi:hypothetical protein
VDPADDAVLVKAITVALSRSSALAEQQAKPGKGHGATGSVEITEADADSGDGDLWLGENDGSE